MNDLRDDVIDSWWCQELVVKLYFFDSHVTACSERIQQSTHTEL
jgi:hypothetical protein